MSSFSSVDGFHIATIIANKKSALSISTTFLAALSTKK
jgi:hypothetical protein